MDSTMETAEEKFVLVHWIRENNVSIEPRASIHDLNGEIDFDHVYEIDYTACKSTKGKKIACYPGKILHTGDVRALKRLEKEVAKVFQEAEVPLRQELQHDDDVSDIPPVSTIPTAAKELLLKAKKLKLKDKENKQAEILAAKTLASKVLARAKTQKLPLNTQQPNASTTPTNSQTAHQQPTASTTPTDSQTAHQQPAAFNTPTHSQPTLQQPTTSNTPTHSQTAHHQQPSFNIPTHSQPTLQQPTASNSPTHSQNSNHQQRTSNTPTHSQPTLQQPTASNSPTHSQTSHHQQPTSFNTPTHSHPTLQQPAAFNTPSHSQPTLQQPTAFNTHSQLTLQQPTAFNSPIHSQTLNHQQPTSSNTPTHSQTAHCQLPLTATTNYLSPTHDRIAPAFQTNNLPPPTTYSHTNTHSHNSQSKSWDFTNDIYNFSTIPAFQPQDSTSYTHTSDALHFANTAIFDDDYLATPTNNTELEVQLKNRIHELETQNTKLETRNQQLETQVATNQCSSCIILGNASRQNVKFLEDIARLAASKFSGGSPGHNRPTPVSVAKSPVTSTPKKRPMEKLLSPLQDMPEKVLKESSFLKDIQDEEGQTKVELMPGYGIYIDVRKLDVCVRRSKDSSTALCRFLLMVFFSDAVLANSCAAGRGTSDKAPLDSNIIAAIKAFVQSRSNVKVSDSCLTIAMNSKICDARKRLRKSLRS